jgi:AcrR family transcriptional regulator
MEAAVASVDDPTPTLLADAVIAPLWRWRCEHAHLFLETNARAPVSPVSCARVFSCVRRALARFADTAQARLALQAERSPLEREGLARQLNAFAACFRDAIWRACVDESHVASPAGSADNAAAASTPPAATPPQVTYMLLAAAESVADATQVRAQYALSAVSSMLQQP